MANYTVINSTAGECEGTFIADIKLKDENGKNLYYTLCETDGKPMVFKTNSRIYSLLEAPEYNSDEIEDLIASNTVYKGESYDALFESHADMEPFNAIRFVIYLVRNPRSCGALMKEEGKPIDKIEIPKSDVEIEWEKKRK